MEECERTWERLMEERFQLKEYGKLSFFEQAQMPSEERKWYLNRLNKEAEERNKREKEMPGVPNMPSIPSVPRP